jgi:hypothetical protein
MNKSLLFSPAGLALLLVSATAAQAQTHVGVSVTVRQPGVYGRIDIGGGPPAVVYPQPVIITPAPRGGRALAGLPVRAAGAPEELVPVLLALRGLRPAGLLRARGVGARTV